MQQPVSKATLYVLLRLLDAAPYSVAIHLPFKVTIGKILPWVFLLYMKLLPLEKMSPSQGNSFLLLDYRFLSQRNRLLPLRCRFHLRINTSIPSINFQIRQTKEGYQSVDDSII